MSYIRSDINMNYSVVIRTLGKGGDTYQKCLDSIMTQSIKPESVIVYLAEGYDAPTQTVGVEQIVRVPKGMVAQRALQYDEVTSEYMLLLDDDVYLPTDAVETLYGELISNGGDVISPIVFDNKGASPKEKIIRTLTGREVCRPFDGRWANKVLMTGGFSYNNRPSRAVYESQSNAGPCLFCKKDVFLNVRFQDELWLDQAPYAFPEDQVLFYKMHRMGYKVLSSYDSGIVHMDASTTIANTQEKTLKVIYSEYRNKLIFWHRFIYLPSGFLKRLLAICSIAYAFGIQFMKYAVVRLRGNKAYSDSFSSGLRDGIKYLKSEEYKALPRI